MTGTVTVRNPGVLSLVQDTGRFGYQRFGVSVSGAMDQEALMIGNMLVGDEHSAAGIEITLGGAEFEVSTETLVAITGADLSATLDGTPLPVYESFIAPAGSVIRFSGPGSGIRAYLLVRGGFDTPPALNSRATHIASGLGGLTGKPLQPGDELPIGLANEMSTIGSKIPSSIRRHYSPEVAIRVVPGPQESSFSAAGVETFYSSEYSVTDTSDRQGLRLEGPEIESSGDGYDIISDGVTAGAIQVPADGRPIILMADRQTIGGYAKIGVVATVDLPLLAQAGPGSTVRFERCTVADTQALLRDWQREISDAPLMPEERVTSGARLEIGELPIDVDLEFDQSALTEEGGALLLARINGIFETVRARRVN